LSLMSLAACGGKPFNVQPRPATPHAIKGAEVEVNGVTLQAEAVTDENLIYDTFDANLILAGILPVRVKVTNSRPEPFEIRRARFEVRGPGGRTYKSIRPDRAYKRLMSYYDIGTYNKDGYRRSRSDFEAYGLNTSEPLGVEESRQGILFFPVPDEEIRAGGLTFVARRIDAKGSDSDSDIEIRLN
ncbi:MAG TPA: hypothetical protein VNO14_00445, partial [Blastocatellia bacterium]|nr:hypothetical protein [Blastocatellia bacterium]